MQVSEEVYKKNVDWERNSAGQVPCSATCSHMLEFNLRSNCSHLWLTLLLLADMLLDIAMPMRLYMVTLLILRYTCPISLNDYVLRGNLAKEKKEKIVNKLKFHYQNCLCFLSFSHLFIFLHNTFAYTLKHLLCRDKTSIINYSVSSFIPIVSSFSLFILYIHDV